MSTMPVVPADRPEDRRSRDIEIQILIPSPTNPRKTFDRIEELAESVKKHGVLQPLLLREWPQGRKVPNGYQLHAPVSYELVAGERRLRAAITAKLTHVPALVRELTDVEVLEIQIIENLQREGLHPLEEAHGYHALIAAKCDVQKIASRVGRSVGYVYDRVKLLSLTKAAQKAFLAGAFEAGHAIILARLSPEDQAEAIEHGLFTSQRDLALTPEDVDAENAAVEAGEKSGREYRGDQKAVSVRELQGWVDRHTKVEAHQVDPMLFPETAMTLHDATLQDAKVVRITHEQLTPEELQGDDEGKVILGRSWRRADGFHGSKPCPRSVIGMVVIGPGRGQAFSVCISKKTCEVHWGAEIRARKKTEKAVAKSGKTGEDREALRRNKEQEDEARRKAEDARWKKAIPQIVDEVALVIAKAPAGAKTPLGAVLLGPRGEAPAAHKLVPLGTTAEQLVRALAFGQLAEDLQSCAWGEWERKNAAPHLKLLGLDLFKLLDQVAPLPAPEKPAAAAKAQGPLKRKAKKR